MVCGWETLAGLPNCTRSDGIQPHLLTQCPIGIKRLISPSKVLLTLPMAGVTAAKQRRQPNCLPLGVSEGQGQRLILEGQPVVTSVDGGHRCQWRLTLIDSHTCRDSASVKRYCRIQNPISNANGSNPPNGSNGYRTTDRPYLRWREGGEGILLAVCIKNKQLIRIAKYKE